MNIINNILKSLNLPVIGRWFILGIIVGILSGVGAIIFFILLQSSSIFILNHIAGLPLEETGGERFLFPLKDIEFKRWMLLIIPTIGGLISGALIYTFCPEAEGHGTDSAIKAIHLKNGDIRPRVPLIKTIASAITIGTGGSGGREGPIAQIGAGFGSYLGKLLMLSKKERRILTAAGMGAGIGAIFRSPLAGAIFAAEVLYASSDLESEVILPSTITSIVAYSIFSSIFGWKPLFLTPDFAFINPLELISYTILGLACALIGFIYIKIFYGVNKIFKGLNSPNHIKPMIGGFLTGVIGFFIPQALGGGYAQIENAMHLELGLYFMVILLIAKIFTTSFTIGSGGSAGIFGPSVVIGALLGGLTGKILHIISPILVSEPGAFVIVGMAGFFAGIARTPLSSILIVSEMTGNYHLLVPSMWVSSISFLLIRGTSIYNSQFYSRSDSPIHREEYFLNVLEDFKVQDIMLTDPQVINENMKFSEVINYISTTKHNCFPVVNEENILVGVLKYEEIRQFVFEEGLVDIVVAGELCDKKIPPVTPNDSIAHSIKIMSFSNEEILPVVNNLKERKLLGIITRKDIISYYNKITLEQENSAKLEF